MEEKLASEGLLYMPPHVKRLEACIGKLSPGELDFVGQLSRLHHSMIVHNMPVKLGVHCCGILQRPQLNKEFCLVIAPYPAYVLEIVRVMKVLDVERSVKVETCDVIMARHISTFEATDANVAVGTPDRAFNMVMSGIHRINMVFYYSGNEMINNTEAKIAKSLLLSIVEKLGNIQREVVQVVFFSERKLSDKILRSFQESFAEVELVSSSIKCSTLEGIQKHEYRIVTEEEKLHKIWRAVRGFDKLNTLYSNSRPNYVIIYADICSDCIEQLYPCAMCFHPGSLIQFLIDRKIKLETGKQFVGAVLQNTFVLICHTASTLGINISAGEVKMIINCSTVDCFEYLRRLGSFPNVSTAITFATKGELIRLHCLQGECGFSFEERDSLYKDCREICDDEANAAFIALRVTDRTTAEEKMMERKNRTVSLMAKDESSGFPSPNIANEKGNEVKEIISALKDGRDVVVHNVLEPGVIKLFRGAVLNYPRDSDENILRIVIAPDNFYVSKIVAIIKALCQVSSVQLEVLAESCVTIVSGKHLDNLHTHVRVAIGTAGGVREMLMKKFYPIDMVVFFWGNEEQSSYYGELTMYLIIKEQVRFIAQHQTSEFESQPSEFRVAIFSEREVQQLHLFEKFLCGPKVFSTSSVQQTSVLKHIKNHKYIVEDKEVDRVLKHIKNHKYIVEDKEVDRVDAIINIIVDQRKMGDKSNTIIYVELYVVYESLLEKLEENGIYATKTKAGMTEKEMVSMVNDFTTRTHVLITPRVWAHEMIPFMANKVGVIISFSAIEPPEYFLGLYLFKGVHTSIMFMPPSEDELRMIKHIQYRYDIRFEKITVSPGNMLMHRTGNKRKNLALAGN